MQMTESEIIKSYNHAENRQKQIKILSELNACSEAQIREILERNGCEVPHYGNRYTGKVKEEPKKEPKKSSVRMSERKKKSDGSKLSARLLKSEEQDGVIKSDEPTAKDWAEFGEAFMQGVRDGLKEAEAKEDVGTCQQDVGTMSEDLGLSFEHSPEEMLKARAQKIPPEVIAITMMKINDLKLDMGAIQEEMDKLQTELQDKVKICNRLSVWLDEVMKEGKT